MKTFYHNQIFPVILEEDDTGGYVVINPAFDGCYSQGESIEEALENIKEATELCIEEIPERMAKHKIIKPGHLNQIIKDAKLTVEEFIKL